MARQNLSTTTLVADSSPAHELTYEEVLGFLATDPIRTLVTKEEKEKENAKLQAIIDPLHLAEREVDDLFYKAGCKRAMALANAEPSQFEWHMDIINNLDNTRRYVLKRALDLAKYFSSHVEAGRHAGFVFPLRGKDNLVFDAGTGTFILGQKRRVVSTRNYNQLKTITRIMWFNSFVIGLLNNGTVSTLRGVYYEANKDPLIAFYYPKKPKPGQKIDSTKEKRHGAIAAANFVTSMESLYGAPHEAFSIIPEERAAIFGDAELEFTYPPRYVGKRIRLDANPEGTKVGGSHMLANITSCNAERIIVIEKDEIFKKAIARELDKTHRAIVVNSAGTGSSGVKFIVKKFVKQFNLRAYIVTDPDVWGLHIARTWLVGSAKNGHLRTAIPSMKYLGATAKEIVQYGLEPTELDKTDRHRISTLLDDPRYKDDPWRQYLLDFSAVGQKAELQGFTLLGLNYFTDTYLPAKMEAVG